MSNNRYIPEDFKLNTKEDILPYFQQLLSAEINNEPDFRQFLKNVSDLESYVSENLAWRYIKMTCNTADEEAETAYLYFVQEIQPLLAPLENDINSKILASPFKSAIVHDEAYRIYFRALQGAVDIYREENIPIQAELQTLAQEYSRIQGAMSIEADGKTLTMQQASNYLLQTDRALREKIWRLMHERRMQNTTELNELFSEMVKKRHQLALNAGFDNFRDYMFKAMGRYDYTKNDCFDFHHAIETHVVPLLKSLTLKRKQQLGFEVLKPWDMSVDPLGRSPLRPFETGEELLEKGIAALAKTDTFFSDCLSTMKQRNLLDLDSRLGKAPGGYNYPLAETNLPFIFMNASGNLRDVETLVHEAGHAIHSFLMAPLELNAFKNTPSEVAELASMSMELISMEGWDAYFNNADELNRAREEQLEGIIGTLPWIATVDAFQHWIYENPEHSIAERAEKWTELTTRFGTGMIDYTGLEDALTYSWQKQLHIYEVPFYYIEYGFAQLGALGVWKNVLQNSKTGIEQYKNALKLGYTRTIPEVYQQAGVPFEFGGKYVQDLFSFLNAQLN